MKKIVIILIGISVILLGKTNAQDSLKASRITKHEISSDILPLILAYNGAGQSTQFYLSYKYRLKGIKIGAGFSYRNLDGPYESSSIFYHNSNNSLKYLYNTKSYLFRLGIESATRGKRIQFVYGADLIAGLSSGYSRGDGWEQFVKQDFAFGISPLLGLNMNISKTVALGVNFSPEITMTGNYLNSNPDHSGYLSVMPVSRLLLKIRF